MAFAQSAQELTDRLVVAVDEQDVLFVLYWLNEMKEAECLVQGIHGKHSWKRYSAITSIARNPPSPHRKLILQLLLFKGLKLDLDDIVQLKQMSRNGMVSTVVIEMLENWERREKVQAVYAKLLLSMSVEQAAPWIDTILPPPPNVASLTGYRPLPPPPSEPYVPASDLDRHSLGYHIPASEAQDPLPYSYPIPQKVETSFPVPSALYSPPRPHSSLRTLLNRTHLDSSGTPHPHLAFPSRRAHPSRESQDPLYLEPGAFGPFISPRFSNPINIAFVRFPHRYTMKDIYDLVPKNFVPVRVARVVSDFNETYAILQVEENAVERLIECLDGIELDGKRKMRCFVTEMTGFEPMEAERQVTRLNWTSDLDQLTLPLFLSSTPSIPSTSPIPKSTLVKKPRSSFSLSSLFKPPPQSRSVPTTVFVFDLPLDVSIKHLRRFGVASEKHQFEQFKDRRSTIAIIDFGSKTSAKRFQNRYNEGQEKKGRWAVLVDSDKSVGEYIKEHFDATDSKVERGSTEHEAVTR